MADIGKRNTLRVVRDSLQGLYLDGGGHGEILLPRRYVPERAGAGDELEVFVYRDSEDRLVATTETPHAAVGEFACLEVVSVNPRIGAFLDWGLSKDLLLPLGEQQRHVGPGDQVVVRIFVDEKSERIVATTRLNRHLGRTEPLYDDGQPVSLMITGRSPLGYNAIVNNAHWGLLYQTDLSTPLLTGQKIEGYVRTVRPDGKIDLSLDKAGYARVPELAERIIKALEANGGHLKLDDKSSPQAIRATFDASKKAFKQALGALYSQRRIRFVEKGIDLADGGSGGLHFSSPR